MTPEVLRGEDSWHCPKCKRATESSKEMHIFRTPNALVRSWSLLGARPSTSL